MSETAQIRAEQHAFAVSQGAEVPQQPSKRAQQRRNAADLIRQEKIMGLPQTKKTLSDIDDFLSGQNQNKADRS